MSDLIKTKEDIEIIREGGRYLAEIMRELSSLVYAGATTDALDRHAEYLVRKNGGIPSFLGYKQSGGIAFNSTMCACINEEIVHAPAHPGRLLNEGDIFSMDIGMNYKGYFTDMAITVGVGDISSGAKRIIDVTKNALEKAICAIRPGLNLRELGKIIQNYVEGNGYQVVRALVGHGVGYAVHEEPQIPNYEDERMEDFVLFPGMVLALEPMVVENSYEVEIDDNGWTVVPRHGGLSAHFEHTVVVTENGCEILTK